MNRYINYIDVKYEVLEALRYFKPIVALESAIISHGMPYPENYNIAKELEDLVRSRGAVPATMAIIDGRLKVGLEDHEIELLAKSKNVIKASRRDISWIVSKKLTGSTTVSSTMIFASMAGIRVLSTGGIGGVHRGAELTFDISTDLTELAKTDVAVVCSGVKSILDIGLTLEKLETLGVPVIGYKTSEFPSFYTRKSGFGLDAKMETPLECAEMLKVKWDMDLSGGVVIANPIPEAYEADVDLISSAINNALAEAKQKKVRGKGVTPFLLSRIKELTTGESLTANMELVRNNAILAADIAVPFSRLDENRKSIVY